MACIDFAEGPVGRVTPEVESTTPVKREKLFDCEHFRLWRVLGESPFTLGAICRACSHASRARDSSSTTTLMPPEKVTYSFCRQ
jgi:hypothetical protein